MQNDAPTLHGVFQGLNPLSLNPLPKMASPHKSISPNGVTQSPPKVFFHIYAPKILYEISHI